MRDKDTVPSLVPFRVMLLPVQLHYQQGLVAVEIEAITLHLMLTPKLESERRATE
jgi:hypothetical protein